MHVELKGRVLWHVNIVARNGETVLSSETYFSKANALRAANNLSKALKIPFKQA